MGSRVAQYQGLKRLNNRHRIIAALEVAGWKDKEIAERVGIGVATISTLRHSPLYQALIAVEREKFDAATSDLYRKVVEKAPAALERVGELMEQDDNRSVALAAANSILDRALPKKAVATDGVSVKITVEEAARLRAVMDEDCVDVTPIAALPERDHTETEPPRDDDGRAVE